MRIICYSLLFFALHGMVPSGHAETATPPQDADPDAMFVLRHHDHVDALYEEHQAEYAEQPHMLVRRGLLADRKKHQVEIFAEASGLPPNDLVEFMVISETSGHDYEALAISHARPSDIHAALEFIGMEAGEPLNPPGYRYFPKGERVFITFIWTDDDGTRHERRAEELVLDDRTGTSLPKEGFVFVGSQWMEENGDRVYAADRYGPQSIVSVYNEPTTVFDVPRAVSQRDVYGVLRPYPERQADYGQLLRIRIVPEFTDGQRRVADVALDIRPGTEDDDAPILLTLLDEHGDPLHEEHSLHHILAALNRIAERGQTPFMSLRMDEETPLHELRDLLRLLRAFQQEGELHIEPPRPGDLLYRAFLPVEAHRDRANRPSQALELHLERRDNGLTGRLIQIEDHRQRREDPFDPEITEYDVASPEALQEMLHEIQHALPVLLLFVPSDATYGAVMTWVRPVMDTHPMIHLFL